MSAAQATAVPFRYRASTADGQMREGVVRAASRDDAFRELRRQALWPVQVEAEAGAASTSGGLDGFIESRRRAVSVWTRLLATLAGVGMPLDQALRAASEQVRNPQVRAATESVRQAVRGGATLTTAMRAHPMLFGTLHLGLVQAGEGSGALASALDTLAGYLEDDETRRAQLASALLYPALVALVSTVGVLVLLLFVVPRFTVLLGDLGGTLPWSTRTLVALGTLVRRGWWIALIICAVGAAVLLPWLRTAGAQRTLAEIRRRTPFVRGLDRSLVTARFTRALGLLLQGGMPLLPALRLARGGIASPLVAGALDQAIDKVARGGALSASLDGVLTPLAIQLLSAGEASAQLPALALRSAEAHDVIVQRTLRTLASLMEPALVLIFGSIVGFVALAMLQAIYAVNAGLQ